MREQSAVQKLLQTRYEQIRQKNSSYSLRAFARTLDVSVTTLSELLNGKRKASFKFAKKVSERLSLTPEEQNALLSSFPKRKKKIQLHSANSKKLREDEFSLISDWYHFAILQLSEVVDYRHDPNWIAQRLNITDEQATAALERLERLRILYLEDGILKRGGSNFTTSDNVVNMSIRKHHAQSLELALKSLEKDSIDMRDFTSMTMAIDPTRIPEAKKMIRKFRDQLCDFMQTGQKEEVYMFFSQLIPLSRKTNESQNS